MRAVSRLQGEKLRDNTSTFRIMLACACLTEQAFKPRPAPLASAPAALQRRCCAHGGFY